MLSFLILHLIHMSILFLHLRAIDLSQINYTPCIEYVCHDKRNQDRDKTHHL